MNALAVLFAGFVVIGVFARTFDAKTRLILFLFIAAVVVYVTIK